MFAKVFVVCAALAAAHASAIFPLVSTGTSISSRQQDGLGNYAFSYGIADGKGATNSRSEVGDAVGNKKGAYTLTDIDGRARRVDYVADGLGFRASVKTNEPGTAASAPAAAVINSPYAAPVAPVDLAHAGLAAPAVLAPGIAAPFVAAPGVLATSAINHIAGAPLGIAPIGLGYAGLGYGAGLVKGIY